MPTFTRHQKSVIAMLAFLEFTIVLDFMILSPLGAVLLRDLGIATTQFGLVVSAYAFSAGTAGLLTAGFADKFDLKRLLLFFYSGFVLGTRPAGSRRLHGDQLFVATAVGWRPPPRDSSTRSKSSSRRKRAGVGQWHSWWVTPWPNPSFRQSRQ